MMINCDKCNAAYQVDETQVGPDGLKLVCTTCQHPFRVVAKTFYLVEGPGISASVGEDAPKSLRPITTAKTHEERKHGPRTIENFDAGEPLRKFGQIAPASSPPLEVLDYGRERRSEKKSSWGVWLLFLLVLGGGAFFWWRKKNPEVYQETLTRLEEQSQSVMDKLSPGLKVNEEARSLYMQGKGAYALDTQEHYLAAIEYYRKAIAKDPNYAAAHGALAEADLEAAEIFLDTNTALAREYLDEALRAGTKANILDPHNLEGKRAMAAYEMVQGNFVKSQDSLNQMLASNPSDAETHILYARNYMTKDGLEDMAQEYLRKAISINDLSIRAHHYLAINLEKKNQPVEALKEWQKVLDLNAQHELASQKIAAAEAAQKMKSGGKNIAKDADKSSSAVPKIVSSTGSHPEEPHEAGPVNVEE